MLEETLGAATGGGFGFEGTPDESLGKGAGGLPRDILSVAYKQRYPRYELAASGPTRKN